MQTLLPPLPETVQLTLANCKQQLQQHYHCKLKALILYGSAAKQQLTSQSDLDLLVLLAPPGLFPRTAGYSRFAISSTT